MNGRNSKLLRKIAKLSGRDDKYIKKTFKQMEPHQQVAYLAFLKASLKQMETLAKKDPTQTIVTDVRQEVAHGA